MTVEHRHPCPAGDYEWYVSRSDDGPWLPAGPTRETAISEALGQEDYFEVEPTDEHPEWRVAFMMCRARPYHVDLSRKFDADDWLDWVGDQFEDEEGGDEYGDRHPLEGLSTDDIKSLEESVRSAIWHWQNRRGLPLRSYWLDMKGAYEEVVMPHPENSDE